MNEQTNSDRHFKLRKIERIILWVTGIILPLAALLVETFSSLCAPMFFDPIPTLWHSLLILTVPIANWSALRKIRQEKQVNRPSIFFFGLAMGTSAVYSILFAPIMPFAAMYTMLSFTALFIPAILTLLPLAPFFSFITSIRILRHWAKSSVSPLPARALAGGIACALVALLTLEVPRVVARIGSERLSRDPDDLPTLTLMRYLADRSTLLKASYYTSNGSGASDFVEFLATRRHGIFVADRSSEFEMNSRERAQEIYFRVTGEHFTSQKRPDLQRESIWSIAGKDPDRGSDTVGGRVDEVKLSEVTLDGSIDAEAALGYLEWTLQFTNDDSESHEARFEALLPEGAVVSRASLWINGEEREAAIGGRAEVRAAYKQVVQVQRRDPLLVTTVSTNRILVQCFPVPSTGAPMKIKLGITLPLRLRNKASASFNLPTFSNVNFSIPSSTQTRVWLESKGDFSVAGGFQLEGEGDTHTLRTRIPFESSVGTRNTTVTITRNTDNREAWTEYDGQIFEQTFADVHVEAKRKFVVVIDGSSGMRKYRAQLANAIRKLPRGLALAFVLADDVPVIMDRSLQTSSEMFLNTRAKAIEDFLFEGGRDNIPALAEAWDIASSQAETVVLWIHAEQPIVFNTAAQLEQRFRRRPNATRIIDLPVSTGSEKILENGSLSPFFLEQRDLMGSLESLSVLLETLATTRTETVTVRKQVATGDLPRESSRKTSAHLARLVAYEQINELLLQNQRIQALQIAAHFRLVTAVSGAVVLETVEQYQRQNLTPPPEADDFHIPSVPEPEEWALLLIGAAALLCYSLKFRSFRHKQAEAL